MKLNIDFIYPIGSIYMTVSSTNPQVLFGGTWERVANGRCLVGVDTYDNDFAVPEKTGGEKTHQLTTSEMPSHNHQVNLHSWQIYGTGNAWAPQYTTDSNVDTQYTGGNQPHNNLQPYYCVYIWKRTA